MPITRRQFIQRSAVAATVGIVLPRFLGDTRAQETQLGGDRKFVIVQLAGGNDGLNTVVPYADSNYHALRPTIGWKDTELRTAAGASTIISDSFGFHPAMSEIKALYDAGKVAVVLGAGYPNSNLSHFFSMDVWHTADTSGLGRIGWIGRFADIALVGQPSLTEASLGMLDLPKTFFATKVVVPNILNLDLYNFVTDAKYPGDNKNQRDVFRAAAARQFPTDALLGSLNGTAADVISGAQRLQAAVNNYQSSVVYPATNPLAVGLKLAAQLLVTVAEATILYVKLDGFDHHAFEVDGTPARPNRMSGQHFTLLHWFSEAIGLFHDDLSQHGLADKTLIMQWSEFGRRPGENDSLGTDHGTSSPMFIVGDPVIGGLYGEQPSLARSALDAAGNPKVPVDFRSVYATILDRWLGADSRQVLGANYVQHGFL